jgi:hypothetical protein
MKFFIPLADNEQQAEEVYTGIKKFAKENLAWNIQDDRIYSLSYRYNGQKYFARVSEVETLTHDFVVAILKSNAYLICTKNRGVLRGEPILVGYQDAISIEYFD